MDRKTYMRDIYSKYWITAREKIYGFLKYDENLCKYICQRVPEGGKLLEVGIGTGYPFGDFFQRAGYSVYGVDISPDLIEKCRQLNPNIKCKVGDAEDLNYPDDCFDCVYCFHSTWYFPNLNKVIDEMLRITRPNGLVVFDIQNRNNKEIENGYHKRLSQNTEIGKIIRYAKNVVKIILRRGTPVWHFVDHEVPSLPESIYDHLERSGVFNFQVMVKNVDESIESRSERCSFEDFSKLVFVIRK